MMQDQLIMARAYLQFASSHGSAHLIRELKMRIKEIERAISHSSGGSRVTGSALQKMKAMELTLSKAQRAYPHCSHMASKLRAMTYNSEELVRAHQSESSFLEQVAVRTLPKGHHCLAMRLTSEYFSLDPKERDRQQRHLDAGDCMLMLLWTLTCCSEPLTSPSRPPHPKQGGTIEVPMFHLSSEFDLPSYPI